MDFQVWLVRKKMQHRDKTHTSPTRERETA